MAASEPRHTMAPLVVAAGTLSGAAGDPKHGHHGFLAFGPAARQAPRGHLQNGAGQRKGTCQAATPFSVLSFATLILHHIGDT
ncbi:hypothetical protein E2C01_010621 [Portunus trituberculatus]|uniref:Uncharacterized protein n=1 Tax=Portunus trituberculatus TaxID=210409 RepID=A0A5B7D986_PORTR|nr:hypothetical protein [Portunus trituberculatus]